MDQLAGSHNDETVFDSQLPTATSSTSSNYYFPHLEDDFQWDEESVRCMLNLVQMHFEDFYDKTVKKRFLWKKIAEKMRETGYQCTTDECDKKWRNMKKSYISVLQKHVQGDFSSKFAYFEQMHKFLGKEIDPLGMRETELRKALMEKQVPETPEMPQSPFYEVTNDNGFEWIESAVNSLLDQIIQQKSVFKHTTHVEGVWQVIANKLRIQGFHVTSDQCQRKWVNLCEGFKYYQAEAEVLGIYPSWIYFTKVRNIKNSFNTPVSLSLDSQSNMPTIKGSLKSSNIPPLRIKRRKLTDNQEKNSYSSVSHKKTVNERNIDSAVASLQKQLNVNCRLKHLEMRVERSQKQFAATQHTNDLLSLILNKLKSINRGFGEDRLESNDSPEGLKESILLNTVSGQTSHPLVDEAACRQAILDMPNFANIQFIKAPKVELVEGVDNDGIIIVEGI